MRDCATLPTRSADVVAAARAAAPPPEPTRQVIRPAPAGGPEFEIVAEGGNSFVVLGEKPRRWVQQTDFGNDEAVGYLADRLARIGIEEALAEAGATARCRGRDRRRAGRRRVRLGPRHPGGLAARIRAARHRPEAVPMRSAGRR